MHIIYHTKWVIDSVENYTKDSSNRGLFYSVILFSIITTVLVLYRCVKFY